MKSHELKNEVLKFLVKCMENNIAIRLSIDTVVLNIEDLTNIVCHDILKEMNEDEFVHYNYIHFYDEYVHEHSYSGNVVPLLKAKQFLSSGGYCEIKSEIRSGLGNKIFSFKNILSAIEKCPQHSMDVKRDLSNGYRRTKVIEIDMLLLMLLGKTEYANYKAGIEDKGVICGVDNRDKVLQNIVSWFELYPNTCLRLDAIHGNFPFITNRELHNILNKLDVDGLIKYDYAYNDTATDTTFNYSGVVIGDIKGKRFLLSGGYTENKEVNK